MLTFVWVWKSLKPVRLSPVQCSDSGHAVAHDCWSPDVALRASGSNNSPLSSFSWIVVAIMSVISRVWIEYRSTSFSLLDELSLKNTSAAQTRPSCRWKDARLRFGKTHDKPHREVCNERNGNKLDILCRSAQNRFDLLTFLHSDICFVILLWWVILHRGFNAHLSPLLLL